MTTYKTSRVAHNGNNRYSGLSLEDRFWSKVDKSEGCWEWLAAVSQNGYGAFSIKRRMRPAHRVAYELLVGPIPEGLHLDHLCRNPLCVNPEHLEPVTCRENLLRGEGPTAQAARASHCPRGHVYDIENTHVTKQGFRHCRICDRDRHRAARVAKDTGWSPT